MVTRAQSIGLLQAAVHARKDNLYKGPEGKKQRQKLLQVMVQT